MALAGLMQGLGPRLSAAGVPGALQSAAPLLLSMAQGLQSGQGAFSQAPMGLALMMAQAKERRAEEQAKAASDAFQTAMGGTTVSGANMPIGGAPTGFSGLGKPGQPSVPGTASAARWEQMYGPLEQKFQLPSGYLARTAQIESGGRADAANPNSSARGVFQFTKGTASQYGVDPMDPTSSTVGAARLAADNASHLRRELGREPQPWELYLAHQQGAGGAAALLKNPEARAADVVGADAVRLNGGNADMTAQDFASIWMNKFGGTPAPDPMMDPQVKRLMQLSAMEGMTEPQRAAINTMLQARIATIGAQGQEGISPDVAARLGMEQWQAQQPPSAGDRYQEVGGRLVDLYAPGGPQTVMSAQQDPMSAIGKLRADLDAGRITQEQFDLSVQNMAPPNMTIESDGQGGFRLVQGTGPVGRPLTEGQSKDNFYLTMAEGSLPAIDNLEQSLVGVGGAANQAAGALPMGEFLQSEEYQTARAAAMEFGAAILRKESGAALTASDHEWLTARFIPVPGDKPATVQRKREARARAIAGLRTGMSPDQIKAVENAIGSVPDTAGAPTAIPQSAIDAGIDPDLWQYMSPEDKALWQN